MKNMGIVLMGCLMGVFATTAFSGQLANPSFEFDLGSSEDLKGWGDHGSVWGEVYQVSAGQGKNVKKAYTGLRMILINVPPGTWDGVWQQIPWKENTPFAWDAYYQIKDGDLPDTCWTFMKVEFYDDTEMMLGTMDSDHYTADTQGRWVKSTLKGVTPPGTTQIRFVLCAGDNVGGTPILDRIFWDDADTTD